MLLINGFAATACRAPGVVASPSHRLAARAPSSAACGRQRHCLAARAAARSSNGDEAAAGSGSAADRTASSSATSGLLQRVLVSGSLADHGTLLLIAALGSCMLLGAAEPALAAHAAPGGDHAAVSQLLGDLAENEDFWGNVLRYISYFFSVLLGTAYIAVKPLIELMKKPTTAVLVVGGLAGLFFFVSFTVQAMLGMNESIDFTASSIVTPLS